MPKGIYEVDYMNQRTILNKISCIGKGVHSGKIAKMSIMPAPEDYGIRFIRTDLNNSEVIALYNNVVDTKMGTTIANADGVKILTIEHFMAALWSLGICNAKIELDNEEIPIMDGSSRHYMFLLESAGIKELNKPKNIIEIKQEYIAGDEKAYLKIEPANNFEVDMHIEFDSPAIGMQKFSFKDCGSSNAFKNIISSARTFGFLKDLEYLKSIGLGKGASTDNAIGIDINNNIMNKSGLRYVDEFARHKLLDCIGDMFIAGAYIKGKLTCYKSGHGLNNILLRKIIIS